jgi:hypothetical protein
MLSVYTNNPKPYPEVPPIGSINRAASSTRRDIGSTPLPDPLPDGVEMDCPTSTVARYIHRMDRYAHSPPISESANPVQARCHHFPRCGTFSKITEASSNALVGAIRMYNIPVSKAKNQSYPQKYHQRYCSVCVTGITICMLTKPWKVVANSTLVLWDAFFPLP